MEMGFHHSKALISEGFFHPRVELDVPAALIVAASSVRRAPAPQRDGFCSPATVAYGLPDPICFFSETDDRRGSPMGIAAGNKADIRDERAGGRAGATPDIRPVVGRPDRCEREAR